MGMAARTALPDGVCVNPLGSTQSNSITLEKPDYRA